ncbi:hypothetical protein BsIDN1_47810 [Bacillus safensis]|uniref:Uncharacterized protein n=1 Tax=Bacillus safensis TaxID=561879 RepID=A0A5S9MDG8_BACIA|nr:hypothetical protein BsIDN1_47810 [Bacillus safensis]
MVEEAGDDQSAIVVAKAGWNPGVVGIVASKLTDTFSRPAIVLGIDEETQMAKRISPEYSWLRSIFPSKQMPRHPAAFRRAPDGSRDDTSSG